MVMFILLRDKRTYLKEPIISSKIGIHCNCFFGDGYKGLPKFVFDKIIVTCGAPFIPSDLLSQLKVGGKMVVPVGEGSIQEMNLIEKWFDEEKITNHGKFSFVPMSDKQKIVLLICIIVTY